MLLLIFEAVAHPPAYLAQYGGAGWGQHAAEVLDVLREAAQTFLSMFLPQRSTQAEILGDTHGARQVRGAGRKIPCGQSDGGVAGHISQPSRSTRRLAVPLYSNFTFKCWLAL